MTCFHSAGDFKGNILHMYAHMLEHAKNNGDFRLKVAQPKIGKVRLTACEIIYADIEFRKIY